AERASSENSSSASSSAPPEEWGWISRACSPFRLRSNKRRALLEGQDPDMRPRRADVKPPPRMRWPRRPAGSLVFGLRRGLRAALAGRLYMPPARPDADIARRHHGGNGVLVDHLADGVAQQHHELVERFDGALQLDAVDEVDRNRNALPAQRVQERVLQGLPLGHGVSPAWLLL